jgi:maleamate amidohydrolase
MRSSAGSSRAPASSEAVPVTDDKLVPAASVTLGFGRQPALLIVDFVRAYLDPESPLYAGVETTLAHCMELLAEARGAGVPVFWTDVEYEPGGANGGVFYRKLPVLRVFDRGSPLGEFAAGLEPREHEPVITKQHPSAFFGTGLDELLHERGIDTVLIAGLTTSGCIRASAVDAMQYGFIPVVVREAVGDRSGGAHEANLYDLQLKYADVVSLADVVTWLRGRATGQRA